MKRSFCFLAVYFAVLCLIGNATHNGDNDAADLLKKNDQKLDTVQDLLNKGYATVYESWNTAHKNIVAGFESVENSEAVQQLVSKTEKKVKNIANEGLVTARVLAADAGSVINDQVHFVKETAKGAADFIISEVKNQAEIHQQTAIDAHKFVQSEARRVLHTAKDKLDHIIEREKEGIAKVSKIVHTVTQDVKQKINAVDEGDIIEEVMSQARVLGEKVLDQTTALVGSKMKEFFRVKKQEL